MAAWNGGRECLVLCELAPEREAQRLKELRTLWPRRWRIKVALEALWRSPDFKQARQNARVLLPNLRVRDHVGRPHECAEHRNVLAGGRNEGVVNDALHEALTEAGL